MNAGSPICLKFGPGVPAVTRARMEYAFRVYAAIFGHLVVQNGSTDRASCFGYGVDATCTPDTIPIPARYRPRDRGDRLSFPIKHGYAGEDFHLFFGLDETTASPDWLAEIFEWLSSGQEMDSLKRDSVDRIPFSETAFGRYRLSPREPHALKLMAWLEAVLRRTPTEHPLPKPPSPLPGVEHFVVCSHDIDFYHTGRASSLVRLLKNLVIAFHIYRSWDFFRWNAARLPALFFGQPVGAYLPPLLDACERHGFISTLFVVSNRFHRRDPNYTLQTLAPLLLQSCKRGFSIGLHGSYESIVERADLRPEIATLREAVDERPLGGRQHYLRYDNHRKLFATIEQAGLFYDSTLGFTDAVGFRQGASFAFPPYDFDRERPHDFLEIPLALMDGGLEATCRSTSEDPCQVADAVLQASRKWGWGGIAIDWHNPIEPIQVPARVNNVFWHCLKQKNSYSESWVSAEQFLRICLSCYRNAGLLERIRIDA